MTNPLHILLVEDNPGDVRLIREMLFEAGAAAWEVTVADRLSDGRAALENGTHDAVLLDLTLPDSVGLETLAQLDPEISRAAVIVLTGLDDEAAAVEALRKGAQDYLVKDRMTAEVLLRSIHYAVERKRVERALLERERQLERKNRDLEELNAALRVLLKQREEDKAELEERLLVNFRELVGPLLDRLKASDLTPRQQELLQIVETQMNDILSPFLRAVSTSFFKLTPTEVQIANMVKHGRSTKEIANLMNLSARTVEVNRNNIRKKIGIANKKVNLRTYLLSLQ